MAVAKPFTTTRVIFVAPGHEIDVELTGASTSNSIVNNAKAMKANHIVLQTRTYFAARGETVMTWEVYDVRKAHKGNTLAPREWCLPAPCRVFEGDDESPAVVYAAMRK